MNKKTLLIVGGHLAPALAIIEEVRKNRDWQIVFLGRKFAMEGKIVPSLEYEVIPKLGIPFYSLETGRLQRKWTSQTIPSLLRIPLGFTQSFLLLLKLKPNTILSFGGYLSLPVVLSGWLLRIPIIIHEQTLTSGLGNRLASFLANLIAISHERSSLDFPYQKTRLVGNPIRSDILAAKKKKARPPLILITGGSQGSQTINKAVDKILPKLLDKYQVIHQTGLIDYNYFLRKKEKLPLNLQQRYQVLAIISPFQFGKVLERAALVVGRSGANTVSEIAAIGIPAIFIPIPWSERQEQLRNAESLEKVGLAKIITQDKLIPNLLLETVQDFLQNPPPFKALSAAKKLIKKDAAEKLVRLIDKYMA